MRPPVRARNASPGHHRNAAVGAGAVLLAGNALPALAPLVPALAAAMRVPTRLAGDRSVAITFDDGPHPEGTPAVLAALAREGVTATFFLVGEQVRREPTLAAEIAAGGHAIQLHCERHRNQLRLSGGRIREDMRRGAEAIADATGAAPAVHRPPYGIYSALGLREVRRSAFEPLIWSRWGHDWRASATAESVAAEATESLRGGDVILLHDADHYSDPGCWQATAGALPRIIESIRQAGLEPVPVRDPADLRV